MTTYRAFGSDHGWSVLGLHQDLSYGYPVAPLLGADSAQAEIALQGQWHRWPAVVASVMVRSSSARLADRLAVVQLTVLDTGPLHVQFTARGGDGGVEVALLSREPRDQERCTADVLDAYVGPTGVRPGDHVGTHELGLVHARVVRPGRRIAVEEPLPVLGALAAALAGTGGPTAVVEDRPATATSLPG